MSMRVATEQLFQRSLASMLSQQAEVARARDQIATGKRILSPSDDPVGATRVLDIDHALALTEQYQVNAGLAGARLEQADSVLNGVFNAVQRVRELALQGRSEQLGDTDRAFIAAEVRERLAEVIGLANTRDANGEYLYAGFRNATRPFSPAAGGAVYAGDDGARVLQIGADRHVADRNSGAEVFMAIRNGNGTFVTEPGTANAGTGVIDPGSVVDAAAWPAHDYRIVFTAPDTFDVIDDSTGATLLAGQPFSAEAPIVFDGVQVSIRGTAAAGDVFHIGPSANQSVFATLERLAGALETPLSTPQVQAGFAHGLNRALTDIDRALEHLLEMRTSVGARLKSVDSQQAVNEDLAFQLVSVRASLQDLDLVDASIRLNQGIAGLQAAQQAFARTQNLSLFNLL